MDRAIRVSSWLERSVAHGPGQRFVLWVQGCTLACRGCFSPGTHAMSGGQWFAASQLARRILGVQEIEGVTISGGEPMLQAAALADLCGIVADRGLTVMCYSGFTLDQLRSSAMPGVAELLERLDILVDGPFRIGQAAPLRWRGSRNQQVRFLSGAYKHLAEWVGEAAHVELIVDASSVTTTGVWPQGFVERLEETLR